MSTTDESEYSRARADAEQEFQDTLQHLVNHVSKLRTDAKKSLEEYKGKQEPSNKIMAAYYNARIGAYTELLIWIEFFCSVTEEEKKE